MQLWEDGLDILKRLSSYHKQPNEKVAQRELEIAGRFLRKQIEVMSNYMPMEVRDKIEFAHKEVADNNSPEGQ